MIASAGEAGGKGEKIPMPLAKSREQKAEGNTPERSPRRWILTENISNSIMTVDIFLSRYISMSTNPHRDYRQLQLTLSHIGYFRRGTLLKRFMPCGKPGCACQATPPRLHGPYYQWTRKVAGKTVTVRLSAEQAELLGDWIAAGRELDRIIAEMERLSLAVTDRLLRQLPQATKKPPTTRHPRERNPRA